MLSRLQFIASLLAVAGTILAGAFLAGSVFSAPPLRVQDEPWHPAAPGYAWEFPRDFGAHPQYKTEWWYVTGHLFPEQSSPEQAMAFQLTFFRVGMIPAAAADPNSAWAADDLVMAHASLARPQDNSHLFAEVMWRATPLLGGFGVNDDPVLAWCQGPAGTTGRWEIARQGDGFRLRAADDRKGFRYDLLCTPTRPMVFHGQDGYSPKSADGDEGSLYFSYTRMNVSGTVTTGTTTIPVSGTSWMDREIFTNTLGADQSGWDWLSLQLDDGRDLMVYRLRGHDGSENFALGTLVSAAGTVSALPHEAWTMKALESWQSPATGAEYPVRWRFRVPGEGIDLELRAVLAAQENVSRLSGVHYWEGAVTAHPAGSGQDGAVKGRGFVELTGYGEGNRPPV